MGTNLKDLLIMKEMKIADFKDKRLAVDSFNVIYQFLSTIRQRDGTLLKDSQGRVTSHLTGLFNRTTRLMKEGIQPAFVFDGKAPKLKQKERERRVAVKEEATKAYEEAKKRQDIEGMKKYASRTSKLTGDMIDESKELIKALGLPVIQAPCEGEAQVASIVNQGHVFGGVSEDYDSLLYGIKNLIKNLTISGKKKYGATYISVKPKMINISENLNNLGIDQDQLIVLAILVGTDYDPGGVKGIGPKTALKLVKEYGQDFDTIFKKVEWSKSFDIDWEEIYYLIKKMKVDKDITLKWNNVDREKINELLVEEHEFSKDRIENALASLDKQEEKKKQKGLGEWF